MPCRISERSLSGFHCVQMENDWISIQILPERGAEVHSLVHRTSDIDVLWKAPWGLRPQRGNDTQTLWMDGYAGGWQELIPNAGAPCIYKGALLGFHGEASVTPWHCRIDPDQSGLSGVELTTRLARSPLALTRRMRLDPDLPILRIDETVTNSGGEDIEFMWGHHPAYGAPFLSPGCRLMVPAAEWSENDALKSVAWPGFLTIPGEKERHASHTYLSGLREGSYLLYHDARA